MARPTVRDQEAGGSNPLAPTDLFNKLPPTSMRACLPPTRSLSVGCALKSRVRIGLPCLSARYDLCKEWA